MKRLIMTRLILIGLTAAALTFAQSEHAPGTPEHSAEHGGAGAVHPGGPTAGEQGHAQPAGVEHAEAAAKHGEGHAEEPMPNEIWWKWANFAILAVGLGYLIRKHAGPFFRSRTAAIQSGIAESTKIREEAEARAAEIERRVSNLSDQVAQLRAQSKDEIGREGERLRAETEAALRKIQAQAEAEIASAAKHAAHDLKALAAQLALDQAEKQLRERISPPVQQQLTSAFIEDVRSKAGRN